MSKTRTLLAAFDEKKFGTVSVKDAHADAFELICELIRDYSIDSDCINDILEAAIRLFDDSGRLNVSICTCVALLASYLSETNSVIDDYYELINQFLSKTNLAIANPDNSPKTNNTYNVIFCATSIGFFSLEDTHRVRKSIERLLFGNTNAKSAALNNYLEFSVAIDCWTLLLTLCGTEEIIEAYSDNIDFFHSLFASPKIDLSVFIAVAHSLAFYTETASEVEEDSSSQKTLSLLRTLVNTLTNPKSKRNQKSVSDLQIVVDYFENGDVPSETFKIGSDKVTTSNWSQFIRLGFIKQLLQSGFETHLFRNEIYANIFKFDRSERKRGKMGKMEFLNNVQRGEKLRKKDRRADADRKRFDGWEEEE